MSSLSPILSEWIYCSPCAWVNHPPKIGMSSLHIPTWGLFAPLGPYPDSLWCALSKGCSYRISWQPQASLGSQALPCDSKHLLLGWCDQEMTHCWVICLNHKLWPQFIVLSCPQRVASSLEPYIFFLYLITYKSHMLLDVFLKARPLLKQSQRHLFAPQMACSCPVGQELDHSSSLPLYLWRVSNIGVVLLE